MTFRRAKGCPSWRGILGAGGRLRAAQSVAEMSEDESVTFQNKLAFASGTVSSVCR